jgi:hypothetical protein
VCVSYLAAASLWQVERFPAPGHGAEVLATARSIAAEASSPAAPAAASASQSPQTMPASTPATPVPAGLQADGQLEVGCAVTREDGESGPVVGAELTLYNPGSAPVYVSYVGVKWNDGQVTSNVPDGTSVAPGQVVRLPLQLTVSAIAATACLAGWS